MPNRPLRERGPGVLFLFEWSARVRLSGRPASPWPRRKWRSQVRRGGSALLEALPQTIELVIARRFAHLKKSVSVPESIGPRWV